MFQFLLKSSSALVLLVATHCYAADTFTITQRGTRKMASCYIVATLYPTETATRTEMLRATAHFGLPSNVINAGIDNVIATGFMSEVGNVLSLTAAMRAKTVHQLILLSLFRDGSRDRRQMAAYFTAVNGRITQQAIDNILAVLISELKVSMVGNEYTITRVGRVDVLDNHVLDRVFRAGPIRRSGIYNYLSKFPVTTIEIDAAILDLIGRGLISES